jgi:hypothetical protein
VSQFINLTQVVNLQRVAVFVSFDWLLALWALTMKHTCFAVAPYTFFEVNFALELTFPSARVVIAHVMNSHVAPYLVIE